MISLTDLLYLPIIPMNILAQQVFEDTECAIALAESERQREVPASIASAQEPVENIDVSPKSEAFHVSVSRAFGFIYVRAAALGTGRTTTGQTILVRTQDDNLIPLLSANWMEKYDIYEALQNLTRVTLNDNHL